MATKADLLSLLGEADSIKPWSPSDPIAAVYWGTFGAGKTHAAFTFPEPIYLYDLEHNTTQTAKSFPDRTIIGPREYFIPPLGMQGKAVAQAEKFRKNFYEDLEKLVALKRKHNITGTVMIDSISRLTELFINAYVPLDDKGRAIPREYGIAWNYLQAVLDEPKARGINLVLTARSKDEWIGNASTGKQIADFNKIVGYIVDVAVEVGLKENANMATREVTKERKYAFTKLSGKDLTKEGLNGVMFDEMDYGTLVSTIEAYQ